MKSGPSQPIFDEFRVLSALHEVQAFRHVNAYQLRQLVRRGVLREFERGDEVAPPGPVGSGERSLILVIHGELHVGPGQDAEEEQLPRIRLRPGQAFGEMAYFTDREAAVPIVAKRRSRVLFLLYEDFDWLLCNSTAFRRAVALAWEDSVPREAATATLTVNATTSILLRPHDDPFHGELVALEAADARAGLPLEAMARLLAAGMVETSPTSVLLGRIVPRTESVPDPFGLEGQLAEVAITPQQLQDGLGYLAWGFDYVVLVPGDDRAAYDDAIARVHHKLSRVRLWRTPPSHDLASEREGAQVLETRLLPREPRPYSLRRRVRRAMALGEGRGLARGIPHMECRVELCPDEVARAWATGGEAALGEIARREAASLARWARALTGRQVGVALGGGGAWGYAHIALLRALRDRGIPIDIVTGASFGSVVGGYYCTRGMEGLDRLIQRGPLMQRLAMASMVSTRPMEEVLARDFGDALLEDLPVQFYPFATNLTSRRGVALSSGGVALAVRASGSAPGVFGPTIVAQQGRYVDGCVVNNVPTIVLHARSAALRVAANIYPPASRRPSSSHRWVRGLQPFNPMGRLLDAEASGSLLLHEDGVRETSSGTVVYNVVDSRGKSPLLEASRFSEAADIVARAADDERLNRAADRALDQWKDLMYRSTP